MTTPGGVATATLAGSFIVREDEEPWPAMRRAACRFNELANETAGDHFTPREVIRLMVNLLFIHDDELLAAAGTVRKLLDPACGTGGMLAEAQRYLREHNVTQHFREIYTEREVDEAATCKPFLQVRTAEAARDKAKREYGRRLGVPLP